MKLKKVKDTKQPTVKQLQNIAENLRKHFKCFATAGVEVECYNHINSMRIKTEIDYGIYTESDSQATHRFKSWQELLYFYHKLMEGASDES